MNDDLMKAARDATSRLLELERIRDEFIKEKLNDANRDANSRFGAEIEAARHAKQVAMMARELAEVEESLTDPAVGKRVYSDWFKLYGIVEVRTHETVFPSNASNMIPRVGELFVRILKKDGQPSKRFSIYTTYRWKPAEVDSK